MTERVLRFEDFGDKVGQTFTITEAGLPEVPLTLVEADLLRAHALPPSGRPPFSLIFLFKDQGTLPQRLYQITHDTLGTITLFLVPVGRNANGLQYQALFN